MNVKIRHAEEKDIPFIMRVEASAFDPLIQEDADVFRKRIQIFREGFLIFDIEGKQAGYLCGELWNSVPDSPEAFTLGHDIEHVFCRGGKVLYISSFALLPEFRGKGLSERLLIEALEVFKESSALETLVLMVNECWGAAHHIYSKLGFNEVFRIPDVFSNKDGSVTAGIIMTRQEPKGQG